jgi:hypothetical protein
MCWGFMLGKDVFIDTSIPRYLEALRLVSGHVGEDAFKAPSCNKSTTPSQRGRCVACTCWYRLDEDIETMTMSTHVWMRYRPACADSSK